MSGSFTNGTGIRSSTEFFTVLSGISGTFSTGFIVGILTNGTRISGGIESFTSRNGGNFITTGRALQIVSSSVTFGTFIGDRVPSFTVGGGGVSGTRLVF